MTIESSGVLPLPNPAMRGYRASAHAVAATPTISVSELVEALKIADAILRDTARDSIYDAGKAKVRNALSRAGAL